MDNKITEAARSLGQRGGNALAKHPKLAEIAAKRKATMLRKYGADYFKKVRAGKKMK